MPGAPLNRPIRLGARKSALARAQASQVATALAADGIGTTFVGITTTGDLDQRQLTEIGGTGVFVSAVRDALRRDEIDVAVHSLKDLPTTPAEDLEIIAIPAREDTRDVLVGRRLDDLSDGTRLGTGAPRRAMQMIDWAAGRDIQLEVVPIRGNVETRIERVREGKVDAVILAAAGLRRLGLLPEIEMVPEGIVVKQLPAQILDHQVMIPAPGQGALALEIHRSLSIELRERLGSSRQLGCAGRIPCRAGFSQCTGGWLYCAGGGPCSGDSSPWYKSRFDSEGGNWENVTEQLVRTHQSRISPTAGGARIVH